MDIERLKVDESLWPDGAEWVIDRKRFVKWIGSQEYSLYIGGTGWVAENGSWPKSKYMTCGQFFDIIPRPKPADEWVDGRSVGDGVSDDASAVHRMISPKDFGAVPDSEWVDGLQRPPNWNERGDLPPAGLRCEVWDYESGAWAQCLTLDAMTGSGERACTTIAPEGHFGQLLWGLKFRPLRTHAEREREEVIESAVKVIEETGRMREEDTAQALYDASLLRKPAEEVGREELAKLVADGARVDEVKEVHRTVADAILSTYNVTKKGE